TGARRTLRSAAGEGGGGLLGAGGHGLRVLGRELGGGERRRLLGQLLGLLHQGVGLVRIARRLLHVVDVLLDRLAVGRHVGVGRSASGAALLAGPSVVAGAAGFVCRRVCALLGGRIAAVVIVVTAAGRSRHQEHRQQDTHESSQ